MHVIIILLTFSSLSLLPSSLLLSLLFIVFIAFYIVMFSPPCHFMFACSSITRMQRSAAVAQAMDALDTAGKGVGEGGIAEVPASVSTSAVEESLGDGSGRDSGEMGTKLLTELEGRRLRVTGVFDHSKEVLVGEYGVLKSGVGGDGRGE